MSTSLRLIAAAESRTVMLSDSDRHEIQVSGLEVFPMTRWRESILYYLFGIWANKERVTYRPKINFGGVTLRLDVGRRKYYAYGTAPDVEPFTFTGRELIAFDDQLDVEVALMRFVKDDDIQRLMIVFPTQKLLCLWKTERRGEYRCSATGIPASM